MMISFGLRGAALASRRLPLDEEQLVATSGLRQTMDFLAMHEVQEWLGSGTGCRR
jgi:hypothetical protein